MARTFPLTSPQPPISQEYYACDRTPEHHLWTEHQPRARCDNHVHQMPHHGSMCMHEPLCAQDATTWFHEHAREHTQQDCSTCCAVQEVTRHLLQPHLTSRGGLVEDVKEELVPRACHPPHTGVVGVPRHTEAQRGHPPTRKVNVATPCMRQVPFAERAALRTGTTGHQNTTPKHQNTNIVLNKNTRTPTRTPQQQATTIRKNVW